MTIDELADALRRRDCEAVCYFHTDHFEPWSNSIDDESAKAVERMAAMARSSPFARRMSLFYNVFVPYRLASDGPLEAGARRVPHDEIVFNARSPRQEELARDTIRPLVAMDGHEMHLHVHHEYWTRNAAQFDHPVSHWVNDHSTPQADRDRLDLLFKLSRQAIARETGRPFDRWAFIHGNWALNASDPLICHVVDEIDIIMRHGGFGDFSFPAGRSYCDPRIEAPFTCLPVHLPRAYDDARSDPRPVGVDTRVMSANRFFIWNSPIKSVHSSLDYYSAPNRVLFKSPDRLVSAWLTKSVYLGQRLFIKTHAHSMKSEYRLGEDGTFIPHCYPDVVSVFETLARACDRAKVELQFVTVNEVVAFLKGLDAFPIETPIEREPPVDVVSVAEETELVKTLQEQSPSSSAPPPVPAPQAAPAPQANAARQAVAARPSVQPHLPTSVSADLVTLHQAWMEKQKKESFLAPDELYEAKLASPYPLEHYEMALTSILLERYPIDATRIIEIGTGWGGLAILLARSGYEVLGYEGNVRRHQACKWHFDQQIERFPELRTRLQLAPVGLFPAAFRDEALSREKINLCIATNITSSYSATHQEEIIKSAAKCDEFILDLARFGQIRNAQSEKDALFEMLRTSAFKPVEKLYSNQPYEYWRMRSQALSFAGHVSITVSEPISTAAATGVAASPRVPSLPLPAKYDATPLFSVFGDVHLKNCPVCNSTDIAPLWRMPATTLAEPIQLFGGYFNQVPTLQVPGTLYCFDFCNTCETIFLNPVPGSQKEGYRTSDHYIRKMRTQSEWQGYEDVYNSFAKWIPADATVMIDAACGIGQYLHVARQRKTHRWQRLIGLELAEKYVEYMRGEGFDAHSFDLDSEDLKPIVAPSTVDFVAFCEGFEHVERPLDVLRKLLATLRPGGRLYFTAQRYGTDVQAAVRPGEPIYIGERVVSELPQRLACRIVSKTTSSMRYYIVLEK